ncbi:MAG: Maf family protein [Vibrio sp.]
MSQYHLVLASASPRRKALLTQLGYTFNVIVSDVEEARAEDETPHQYVERLSLDKAQAGLARSAKNAVVIGSDTIISFKDTVLEKPQDLADAQRMLRMLSGQVHQVMTAVTVMSAQQHYSQVIVTDVWFSSLSESDILAYWQTGEPQDKAGSYAIQGLGGRFVTRIEGSYYSVVGLPLYETDQLIKKFIP